MSRLIQCHEIDGIVTTIHPNGITTIPAEDCNAAGANCGGGCGGGCGSCGGKKRVRTFTLPVTAPESFHPGQPIRFRYHALHETLGALLVFGLPLLFAVVTLLVWQIVQPEHAESGIALLSSGIALAAGFTIVRSIDRLFARSHPPKLLSIPPAESAPSATSREPSP